MTGSDLELASLWALLFLPLPILALWLLPPSDATGRALSVPGRIEADLLERANRPGAVGRTRNAVRWITLWAIWFLVVLAVAGPRQTVPVPALKVSGRDLAIALDLSGSMVRDDFHLDGRRVTRLDAVKAVGSEFVRRRGGDRVALIVFGSEAYYAAPFPFDVEAVARRIEEATIGISGRATNMSDALGLALKRMERSDAASRVVILLSDGRDNAGVTRPADVVDPAGLVGPAHLDVRGDRD